MRAPKNNEKPAGDLVLPRSPPLSPAPPFLLSFNRRTPKQLLLRA